MFKFLTPVVDTVKRLLAGAKAIWARGVCRFLGHQVPRPSRWDEVPSRTYTCARCGEPNQKLW